MNLNEAIKARHSVRKYTTEPISELAVQKLNSFIETCNQESGLHIQLVTNQKSAFDMLLVKYGWFKNVSNYIALVGKETKDLDELSGYYGEKIVLYAQQLGLSTCWVGGTFSKKKTEFKAGEGEKLSLIISIGYAEKDGKAHRSKAITKLSNLTETSPEWLKAGMEAALLAPTAMNQQKFRFELQENGKVKAIAGGPFGKVDLGIAKYHFEIGSGMDSSIWC